MKRLMLLLCLAAGPVMAQEDPMELQRCVWRCLADSSGASDPRYHQCVAQFCSETPEPAAASPVLTPAPVLPGIPVWNAGIATDGRTVFAGRDMEDGSGRGLYYMCTTSGDSYFAIFGLDGPAATLRFQMETQAFDVPMDPSRGTFAIDIPPGAPFMAALAQGGRLQVMNASGALLLDMNLNGAGQAMQAAMGSCFG